jgi:FkbM family methyltransferase
MTDLCINSNEYFWGAIADACSGKDVFDVGSNEGSMARLFLNHGARTCHLFEPSPDLMKLSEDTLSDHDNVFFNRVGVSDKRGKLTDVEFAESWVLRPVGEYPELRPSPGAKKFQPDNFDTSLITLDEYASSVDLHELGLVKVDTEGYDFRVLRGATETLRKWTPLIMLELSLYVGSVGDSIPEFIDYLLELGTLRDAQGKLIDGDRLRSQYPYHSSCDILVEL